MSVLDRFKDGMSPEDMVLNLLSTVAHISEVEAHHALVLLKRDYAHDLAVKQKAFFGDVSSQGNDGDWHSMSDWLTEVLNSE